MAASLKAEAAGRSSEPSMEDILASIRKIISDENTAPSVKGKAKPPEAKPPEPPAADEQSQDDIDALMAGFDTAPAPEPDIGGDVLELTEDMAEVEPEPVAATPVAIVPPPAEPEMDWPDTIPEVAPPIRPTLAAAPVEAPRVHSASAPVPVPSPVVAPPRFEDHLLSTATDQAISSAFGKLTHTILAQNARTLDDLVQDMLRPMLKAWLDDNLPSLVERLVRTEIDRVSRGGR